MRENKPSKNGIRKINYPSGRASKQDKSVYPWRSRDTGKVGLCILFLISEEYLGKGEVYTRNFAGSGLTKVILFNGLIDLMPWFPEEYETVRGVQINSELVYKRWHNMVYISAQKAGKSRAVGMSHEHPLNDIHLQPLLELVEPVYKEYKGKNKVIPRSLCVELVKQSYERLKDNGHQKGRKVKPKR